MRLLTCLVNFVIFWQFRSSGSLMVLNCSICSQTGKVEIGGHSLVSFEQYRQKLKLLLFKLDSEILPRLKLAAFELVAISVIYDQNNRKFREKYY